MSAFDSLREWYPDAAVKPRLTVELIVRDHCTGLADQERLTRMLGLDVPPEVPRPRPGPAVQPDLYRKPKRSRTR